MLLESLKINPLEDSFPFQEQSTGSLALISPAIVAPQNPKSKYADYRKLSEQQKKYHQDEMTMFEIDRKLEKGQNSSKVKLCSYKEYLGKLYIHIRDYIEYPGRARFYPTKMGCVLNMQEWQKFLKVIDMVK